MSLPIEQYALIGDLHTAALVGLDGSIDWACFPSFDSDALFARLLGDDSNGFWSIAPRDEIIETRRRYRPGTLVLETEFVTKGGVVRVTDAMPIRDTNPEIVRMVEGLEGTVAMRCQLAV